MREGSEAAERPKLGRRPAAHPGSDLPANPTDSESNEFPSQVSDPSTPDQPVSPESTTSSRPVRSTRNQNPKYVDSISTAEGQEPGGVAPPTAKGPRAWWGGTSHSQRAKSLV